MQASPHSQTHYPTLREYFRLNRLLHRKLFYILAISVSLLFSAFSSVHAQTITVSITVRATAKPQSDGTLAWVVDPQATLKGAQFDVSGADPTLVARCSQSHLIAVEKTKLLGIMGEMLKPKEPWLLESLAGGSPQSFWAKLSSYYESGSPNPVSSTVAGTAPAKSGAQVSEQWTLDFVPQIIRSFQIKIETQKATANTGGVPANLLVPVATMADVLKRVELKKLTSDEAKIGVVLTYAPQDLVDKNGQAIAPADIELELMKVARDLVVRARELRMGVCTEKDDQTVGTIQTFAQTGYVLPSNQVSVTLDPAGVFLIEVKDLSFLGGVGFNLTNNQSAADQEFIDHFEKRYSPKLRAQANHIVSTEDVEHDKAFLGSLRPISPDIDTSISGDELIYSLTRRAEKESLTLTGAGSYSPEDQFLGQVDLTGENFVHRDETYTLKMTGGTERQQGNFSFVLPPSAPRPLARKIKFAGFKTSVDYFRDKDQRLGNPDPTKLKERQASFGSTLSFSFDSFSARNSIERAQGIDKARKRIQHQVRADLGFDYRDIHIRPKDSLLPELTNGRESAPNLEISYLLSGDTRHGSKGGVGELDFFTDAKAQKGLSIFGGDFKYDRYLLSVGGQIFFGFASPTDAFLRYERGAGIGSRGTPLFDLFRLGGSQFGRGLEEGEVIGRSVAYDRSELGAGILPLWHLVKHALPGSKQKSASGGAADGGNPESNAAPNIAGIDLSTVYVKVFYDRARLFDTSSFSDVLNPSHGVHGYGAAFELRGMNVGGRRANLTLGYARSPQSSLHRRGVIVTGVSFDF
jgi:hypothetical protein